MEENKMHDCCNCESEEVVEETKRIQEAICEVIKQATEQLDEMDVDVDHIEFKITYNDGFDFVEVIS